MGERQRPGVGDSLRALGATLVEALGTRAELAAVELREFSEHRKRMVLLAIACAVFAHAGLLVAAFFVVVLFWETHRFTAIAGVMLAYLAVAAGAFAKLRHAQRTAPEPFAATLRELKADRELLRGSHE